MEMENKNMKSLEQLSEESLRTAPDSSDNKDIRNRLGDTQTNLIHATLGLSSEVGEFASTVKAHIMYGRTADVENLEEELGDIWWYFNLACNAIGTTPNRIIEMNIEKLKIRYPEKYTDDDALERKDKINPNCEGCNQPKALCICYHTEPNR